MFIIKEQRVSKDLPHFRDEFVFTCTSYNVIRAKNDKGQSVTTLHAIGEGNQFEIEVNSPIYIMNVHGSTIDTLIPSHGKIDKIENKAS